MADYNTCKDVFDKLSNNDVVEMRILQGTDLKETTFKLNDDGVYLLSRYLNDRLRTLRNDLARISVFVK